MFHDEESAGTSGKKCPWLSIFDFSFSCYVTPKVIKVIYILTVIALALVAISMIVRGFDVSREYGIFTLIITAPLYFVISVIFTRIGLEIIMVIFRIGENVAGLAEQKLRPMAQEPAGASGQSTEPPSGPSAA